MSYVFPFGQELHPLVQEDQTPKRVFVLGVYASAVHARWKQGNRVISQALAVASEPRIFWDGDAKEAKAIIDRIPIPAEAGYLEPASRQLNGPSAKVLDDQILAPLGYDRKDAWLCDMLPEARLNPNQKKVIESKYKPLQEKYNLPEVTIPDRPSSSKSDSFCGQSRCLEIVGEMERSQAKQIVLLGDLPIKQFLCKVAKVDFDSLQSYVDRYGYGQGVPVDIQGTVYTIIALAHPRQIGALGTHSEKWYHQHQLWMKKAANSNSD